jgi:peptidoglycan/LPS O-acetylase OafA/YrhL
MPRTQRKALPMLTSLRFFAALLVFMHHSIDVYTVPHWAWYRGILAAGWTGVSLFFVLSGFILAYNYETVSSKPRFYLARFARIYPMYLFAMLWGLAIAIFHSGVAGWGSTILLNLLLLQQWFPHHNHAINIPSWTLSTETLFYIAFPFLIAPLSRLRNGLLWMAIVLCSAILPGFILRVGVAHTYPALVDTLAPWLSLPTFRLCEFIFGVLLGIRFRERMPRSSGIAAAGAAILCGAMMLTAPLWPFESFQGGVMALPFGLLIYTVAGLDGGFLASAPLQIAGESSYALYIVQFPMLATVSFFLSRAHRQQWIAYGLLLLFPLSFALYRLIEVPSRNLILDRFRVPHRRKPEPTADPALP